ncbi:hypothetical protein J6590_019474 [Homalodisca vitripennis]|nr:hypothetical protein J6590_019474 [Homalodisca vitripennis]
MASFIFGDCVPDFGKGRVYSASRGGWWRARVAEPSVLIEQSMVGHGPLSVTFDGINSTRVRVKAARPAMTQRYNRLALSPMQTLRKKTSPCKCKWSPPEAPVEVQAVLGSRPRAVILAQCGVVDGKPRRFGRAEA